MQAAAREVLSSSGLLDASAAGDRIIAAEEQAGRLPHTLAVRDATRDRYRTAVVRAVAALADLGVIDDLGDMPKTLRLTPGESIPDDAFARAARDWVVADAVRAARTDLPALHAHLAQQGVTPADDPGATWAALVELHHGGVLDVSAAPNRVWLTALRIITRTIPDDYVNRVAVRRQRALAELTSLRSWYADNSTCANQGIANYFTSLPPAPLPPGTCSTDECRCSSCWSNGATGAPPAVLTAVMHPSARPASANQDRLRLARLDDAVAKLLWSIPRGVGPRMLWRCLRGEETFYDAKAQSRRPLPSSLLYHKFFGSRPGLRSQAVDASLQRLADLGTVQFDGYRWRHSERIAMQAAAQARAAAAAASATP